MNDLALLLDLFGNSEETKLFICPAIFVWCLQRRRNGGLNSGQKSAIIVTDALYLSSNDFKPVFKSYVPRNKLFEDRFKYLNIC